jgi:CheY-like chemotaxis protein
LDSYQVLLVEGEALIRMMIIEMLEELGHRVSGEAGRISPAVSLAQTAEFDLALLDINIGGEIITAIAEIVISESGRSFFRPAMALTRSQRHSVTCPCYASHSWPRHCSRRSI